MVDETIEVIEYSEESATPDALLYSEHFERGVSVRLLEARRGGHLADSYAGWKTLPENRRR